MPHNAAKRAERVLVHKIYGDTGLTVCHTHLHYDPASEPHVDLTWDPVTDGARFYCRIEAGVRADPPAVVGHQAALEARAPDETRVDFVASVGRPLR